MQAAIAANGIVPVRNTDPWQTKGRATNQACFSAIDELSTGVPEENLGEESAARVKKIRDGKNKQFATALATVLRLGADI